jgi:flagellin-like hook-associated protein FlgL
VEPPGQLSSGKQIARPSDSPGGTLVAMQTRGDVGRVEQYQRNADDGDELAVRHVGAVGQRADLGQRVGVGAVQVPAEGPRVGRRPAPPFAA